MRKVVFALCALILCPSIRAKATETQQVLKRLDTVIAQKENYRSHKEAKIEELKQKLRQASSPSEKYRLCNSIFYEYLHYQADSAMRYLNLKEEIKPNPIYPDGEAEHAICRAEVMSVMGMYNDALLELESIIPGRLNENTRLKYYYACRSCYGWLSDNIVYPQVKQKYLKQTDLYRDSIAQFH